MFIPLLLVLNFLNKPSGQFATQELNPVLEQFEKCTTIRTIKFISAFIFLGINFWMLYFTSTEFRSIGWLILASMCFAIINCTFTMALGHELLHMRTRLSRPLANALLFTVCLPFFTNDHLFGHHKYAGTSRDKSSAPRNMSFYSYLPGVILYRIRRSFFQGNNRLEQLAARENRFLLLINLSVIGLLAMVLQNTWQVLFFFLFQSFVSFLMFELSNYVQHYGLERQTNDNGEPESIGFHHSWNYYYRYTNYLTYLVPLHSYHHVQMNELPNPLPYGPTLPHSYFRMMLLALVPGMWFSKMNPLCDQYTAR